jgi:ParB family transcriptional regulator, chromosome partitioning protein
MCPSRSTHRPVSKQASPVVSSQKLKGGSPDVVDAALGAAEKTFGASPNLSLNEQASSTGSMEGRRRLSGAFFIDIDRIEADPNQPRKRIDSVYLDELAQSIRKHGVLQPISVRYIESTEKYRIVAGECRFTAAKNAGLDELPCWVKSPKENEVLVQQVIENWVRSDLNAFELADSLAILRDANGWTQQQLAEETGKSKGEISKLLSILDLDDEVQSLARRDSTGRVSRRHLYTLSRLGSPLQKSVLERIQRDNLTAVDVEKIAERELKRETKVDGRGPRYYRRSIKTSRAHVSFVFRADTISDEDVLQAIHEIKRQITHHGYKG